MRKIKLLILLSVASFQVTVFVAAEGPKYPDIKRRGRTSTPTDKAGKWKREQRENAKRAPEKVGAETKRAKLEERAGGRPGTRDKVSAWDRRQERTRDGRPVDSKTAGDSLTREKRSAARRIVEKASRWDKHPKSESRSSQQAKLREHVFRGWINGKGRPVGFHYEGAGGTPADGIKVVEGSRSKPDVNGVYKAEIEAGGIKKGYHTFFPRSWSRADVQRAINEAYANRVRAGKASNAYEGRSSSGVRVGMKLSIDGVPRTAYPVYDGKE